MGWKTAALAALAVTLGLALTTTGYARKRALAKRHRGTNSSASSLAQSNGQIQSPSPTTDAQDSREGFFSVLKKPALPSFAARSARVPAVGLQTRDRWPGENGAAPLLIAPGVNSVLVNRRSVTTPDGPTSAPTEAAATPPLRAPAVERAAPQSAASQPREVVVPADSPAPAAGSIVDAADRAPGGVMVGAGQGLRIDGDKGARVQFGGGDGFRVDGNKGARVQFGGSQGMRIHGMFGGGIQIGGGKGFLINPGVD